MEESEEVWRFWRLGGRKMNGWRMMMEEEGRRMMMEDEGRRMRMKEEGRRMMMEDEGRRIVMEDKVGNGLDFSFSHQKSINP